MADTPLTTLAQAFVRINRIVPLNRQEALPISTPCRYPEKHWVCAEDTQGQHDVPPFDNSAVDGYCLHKDDLQSKNAILITDTVPAGKASSIVRAGQGVKVFTGSPLAKNTAAVAMHEECEISQQHIHLKKSISPAQHCRRQGEDFTRNSVIVRKGEYLNSFQLAALSATGISNIAVMKPIRVGILSSGDELIPEGEPLSPAKIHDANRISLMKLFASRHTEIRDLGIISDSPERLSCMLKDAEQYCDVIVISAGMSSSSRDFTGDLMQKNNVFWQLAIKPARPVGLSQTSRGCFVLGLPGNAASCLLSAWLIGLPLIDRLLGGSAKLPPSIHLPLAKEIQKKQGRREFIRAKLVHQNNTSYVSPLPQSSAGLHYSLHADGVLDLPEEDTRFLPEKYVKFMAFPDVLC